MDKTGIEFLDKVFARIRWMKIPAYRRFYGRYGARKARILRDYVIFPLFGIKTIRQLRGKTPYRIEEIYEVLRLVFDWRKLIIAISRMILQEIIEEYEKLPEDKKSRVKITFSIDDTYDAKSGSEMEGTATINDHHDGIVKRLYNPVLLYCVVDWMGKQFCFPLDMALWQQRKKRGRKRSCGKPKKRNKPKAKPKPDPNHKKRWEYAHDMLESLIEHCEKNELSLAGFELAGDNAYCIDRIFKLAERARLVFVARPKLTNSFKIDGKSDNLYYFGREMEGHRWKISRRLNIRYVKIKATHKKYGECVILFYQYLASGRLNIQCLIAGTTDIRADSLFLAFSRRWPIEVFFRNLKQVLAFSSYSGRKLRAVRGHYLLRMLTGTIVEMCIAFIRDNPKWRKLFPDSHITYGDLQGFIIEHYRFEALL